MVTMVFWVVFRALVVSEVFWVLASSGLYDILVSKYSLGHFFNVFNFIYTHSFIIHLYSSSENHKS